MIKGDCIMNLVNSCEKVDGKIEKVVAHRAGVIEANFVGVVRSEIVTF